MGLTSILLALAAEAGLIATDFVLPQVGAALAAGKAGESTVFLTDPVMGLRGSRQFGEHDEDGFRNPHAPREIDLLALGDSQVYGIGVDPTSTWPAHLRERGVDTYGMAIPGYCPVQGLELLERGLARGPRVVVQAVYSGNDLFDAFAMVVGRGQRSELASDDAQTLAAILRAESEGSLEERVVGAMHGGNRKRGARTGLRGWLSDHSLLYGLARQSRKLIQSPRVRDWEDWKAWSVEAGTATLEGEAPHLHTILTPSFRRLALDVDDPRIQEGERILVRALLEEKKRVEATGARFVVLLMPTKELVFEPHISGTSAASHPDLQPMLEAETGFWSRLTASLDTGRVEFVDALPLLRGALSEGRSPYPISNDGHPNRLGHERIADGLLAALGLADPNEGSGQ